MEPMNYGHTGDIHKCPDYSVSLHAKAPFVGITIAKCVDYAGVLIFKCLV